MNEPAQNQPAAPEPNHDHRAPSGTAMKPQTAAKKLGIYLPATPEDFQANAITHAQLRELHTNPPEWLNDLRRNGPHPRPVVAQKLGITIAALKRAGMDKPLTTAQIDDLRATMPDWLAHARAALAAADSAAPAQQEASPQQETPARDAEES